MCVKCAEEAISGVMAIMQKEMEINDGMLITALVNLAGDIVGMCEEKNDGIDGTIETATRIMKARAVAKKKELKEREQAAPPKPTTNGLSSTLH